MNKQRSNFTTFFVFLCILLLFFLLFQNILYSFFSFICFLFQEFQRSKRKKKSQIKSEQKIYLTFLMGELCVNYCLYFHTFIQYNAYSNLFVVLSLFVCLIGLRVVCVFFCLFLPFFTYLSCVIVCKENNSFVNFPFALPSLFFLFAMRIALDIDCSDLLRYHFYLLKIEEIIYFAA